jgi:hypothetical protein
MPDPFERYSRANGCCEGWDSQPSRSQLRTAAVTADEGQPAKKGRGKKDPALCKAAHWKGPHQPEFRIRDYGYRTHGVCEWRASWFKEEPGWFCLHEETCAGCGKILRDRLPKQECPDFHPIAPQEKAAVEDKIARRSELTAARSSRYKRKPVITGPQGYRKRKSA